MSGSPTKRAGQDGEDTSVNDVVDRRCTALSDRYRAGNRQRPGAAATGFIYF